MKAEQNDMLAPGGSGEPTVVELSPINDIPPLIETVEQHKSGRNLAYSLLGLVAIVSIFILADWATNRPQFDNAVPPTAEQIVQIRALSDLASERATRMFDAIVAKALLPILTAIIGYLFGRRG